MFVLDQNFPQPILRAAFELYLPELRLQALWDFDQRLTRDHEDWEVILGLHQLGADGFITNDARMLNRADVVAVIEQTRFSVVVCDGVGDDAMKASGLLLTHLEQVAKHFEANRPQVWRLRPAERVIRKIGKLKEDLEARSGLRVDDYRLSAQALQRPL